jgi:Clp amino terminal domain, pathogenicity island component
LRRRSGRRALEQTGAACLGVAPRLKRALAYALDYADGQTLGDEHILLGMLSVPDSLAAHTLAELGVTLANVKAIVERRDA